MKRLRIVNLLDDFALGGVTLGLRLFDSPELQALGDFRTVAVNPRAILAAEYDADIIITHFPPNWRRIVWFHSLRLRNPQARIIHVEHSYSREWARLHVPHLLRFRMMQRIALAAADSVVVVSAALERWMLDENMVAKDKLRVIYPYSNVAGLADIPNLQIFPATSLIVGAYGRFCTAKGFDRLIDAFKQTDDIDNLHLVIGGFGPDEPLLRSKAAGCDRISFAGKITDVAAFLAKCHIVAVPSRFEAYGQVANEAREAGRPILVSTAGGLPEQAKDAGIIVDCDDPKELVAALQALRTFPLEEMGRNGRLATAGCRGARINQWKTLLLETAAQSKAISYTWQAAA